MTTFLKWLGIILAVIVLAIMLFLGAMRFSDGPYAVFSGGPFKTGELTERPDNWNFLKGRPEIEFQTISPNTSRVVWLAVVDGRLFIVSGYMNTNFGKIWKQWPAYLEESDHIILRIDGKLYEQRLERLMEFPHLVELMTIFNEKYGVVLGSDISQAVLDQSLKNGDFWLFEVVDR
ncbi:MAG: hypothetical protein JJ957_20185 [Pseudomonadales bacterium]|nr:hypothetical protein [Pseudomonadales bacterium]MBO6598004.1 hypothetical protein [Pseudomonadales bacterium]MBO6824520.1 hypothetical protein [Pseudomonadales bacterium]